ncbi:unnamed protein product [Thlaspi arvense]|uniref:Uncharacterized protein n=1 Tax=Thlaspi arvense TaxID=13288 RepID=A0AAU9RPJ9_THLAR|nr:unnamed protein product [Thlaspi arvense]
MTGTWWSSTNVHHKLNKTVALLLETGDLVLSSDSNRSTLYWESFNNPTDTFLPGMRVRVNPSRVENRAFIPWKSENDPSPGRYSLGIDPIGALEIVIWEGDTRKWRSEPWDSVIFTGIPDMFRFTNHLYHINISSPPDPDGNVYFTYAPTNSSDLLRFQIRFDGVLEQFRRTTNAKNWTLVTSNPSMECENYNRCGNYSLCDDSKDFSSGKCSCIDGFKPVYWNQWNNGDFSGGCKRMVPLSCGQSLVADREDGFKVLRGMKEPDFGSIVSLNNSETCKDVCVRDCSCTAFALTLKNKLGQGGFGPVYKGKLQESQEIAVKRLSCASGQGLEELVDEVVVISKLQHRNSVRLLGCCIEREEMMLVYEFMPKKSLDGYLFEKSDVFSLGVILLEIVSGRKISSFYNDDKNLNLLDYAWKLWNDRQAITLADP